MKRRHPTRVELLEQNEELQAKLREAEDTIEAIRTGAIDALVVSGSDGEQTFTLEGSDHAYRVLVESMKEGAVTVAGDGTIYYCNSRFAEMIRKPIEHIVGGTIDQYVVESDSETFDLLFRAGLASSARGEVNILAADETFLPAYLSFNSLNIYDVPAVCMVVTDLTEQKRSEEIIAAEKLARSILNQAAEAIVVADENGRIIRASHAAEQMCGETLALRSFNDVFKLRNDRGHQIRLGSKFDESSAQGLQSDLLTLAMGGQIAQGIEVTLEKASGEYRHLLLSAGPVLTPQNRVLGCTVTLTDITELKRVEAELKSAKEAAVAASASKTAFLANMSHEIRTPLGAVLGFAELLAAPGLTEAQRDDFIAKIKRNGHLLSSLIDDILDLSKVESGHLQIETIDFPLREVLHDVVSVLKNRVMEKGIAFNVVSKGPIPKTVASDPVRLRQVLSNIIGNAIKFTERGQVMVTIEAVASPQGDDRPMLKFSVEDTGCGLTPEQMQYLFEPFKQADGSTTRKYGGTGLGLALSRGLARSLGGDVVLRHATPNEGCCFEAMIWPQSASGQFAIADLSDLESAYAEPARAFGEDIRLEGVRVLLVEDAPDNQFLISRFLKLAGVEVELAENGAVAIEKATSREFDVVLMDVQMPVLDGLEATARLRALGYAAPIIALTAHALKEERDKCLRVGCDDHLTKPVNRVGLLKTIERFCKQGSDRERQSGTSS